MRIRSWWITDHCCTFNRIRWWFLNTSICYVWLKMKKKIKVYKNVKCILLLLTSYHRRRSSHFNMVLLFVWLLLYDFEGYLMKNHWERKNRFAIRFFSQMSNQSCELTRKEQIKNYSFEFVFICSWEFFFFLILWDNW